MGDALEEHLATEESSLEARLRCEIASLARELSEAQREVRTLRDERKTLEAAREADERLRQTQKMEAIGRLASGVAHDFNNILSVILGYAELLASDLSVDAPMRADVEEIRTAAERAAELTAQLLLFSRQRSLEPRVLDLNGLLTELYGRLQCLVGTEVSMVMSLSRSPARVRADRRHMEQAVINLVINAREVMPTGGTLTITTSDVELDESLTQGLPGTMPGTYILLSISDTGAGMSEATQARIFEPFFTTKDLGQGTGLGLSIVFGIVQQCGGQITVESEASRGTTFEILLPRSAHELSMKPAAG